MNREQALYLEVLFENGSLIIINDSGYVDSPVNALYELEETGEMVYSSQVFSDRPLSEVSVNSVEVYKPNMEWKYNSESIDSEMIDRAEDWRDVSLEDRIKHHGLPISELIPRFDTELTPLKIGLLTKMREIRPEITNTEYVSDNLFVTLDNIYVVNATNSLRNAAEIDIAAFENQEDWLNTIIFSAVLDSSEIKVMKDE
jgi:hypothetical protein